jgi:hypothetical protein
MKNKYRRGISSTLVSLMSLPLISCAGQEVPRAEHVDTKSSVKTAELAGAKEVPSASLYLKMAQDGVERAEALMEEKEYDEAKRVLQRAQMDADLALTMTREEELRQEAEDEKERLRKLGEALATKMNEERQG